MLRFHSMKDGLDESLPAVLAADTAAGGVEGNDRRTRVGRVLCRYSLDELRQLINVVRGEMGLLGPRPERSGIAGVFQRAVYRYSERFRVKSGITGWAQVHGPSSGTTTTSKTVLSARRKNHAAYPGVDLPFLRRLAGRNSPCEKETAQAHLAAARMIRSGLSARYRPDGWGVVPLAGPGARAQTSVSRASPS
jgi:Bacterial sugar transferase